MFCTPEQRQIGRWIENYYDIDKVQCAKIVTKNVVYLALRDHEPTILILRQSGRVDQTPEAASFEMAVWPHANTVSPGRSDYHAVRQAEYLQNRP